MKRLVKNRIIFFFCIAALIVLSACETKVSNEPVAKNNAKQNTSYVQDINSKDQILDDSNDSAGIENVVEENNKVDIAFSYQGKSYGFRPNVKNFLIMGIDRSGEVEKSDTNIGTGQCDAIYLLTIDYDNKQYAILQLDRDAMVDMNILGVFGDVVGTEFQQLCLAHAYGDGAELSCENCVNVISKWLKGVPINGYAALQFEALPILTDDIGGVKVYIEDDLSSLDNSLVKGTTVNLTGDLAMKFTRARMSVSDGKNTSRMRRQRTYLAAFKDQLLKQLRANSNIINTLYSNVKPYMCTNMSVGVISNAAVKAMDYHFNGIQTIKGINKENTYDNGMTFMEFWADEASLNETVINLFCAEVK